ncbi:MAG: hypothetical protein WCQ11_04125 [Actinomycetes bacterium]
MTMLPTEADLPSNNHVLVCVVTPENAKLDEIWENIGAITLFGEPPVLRHPGAKLRNLRFIGTSDSSVDLKIVEASDALVVILDGKAGLGPGSISAWNRARDHGTPRHFLATGVVQGRADFDELAAMAIRAMEPELLVRYLPIDSDDEDSLAGVYDVLTSEIHEVVDGDVKIRPGDPEHVTLTADRRDDLFDQLAHLGLDDQALANHRDGLPISISKLEVAWDHPDVISITPIENGVGVEIFTSWLTKLRPTWIPTVTIGDTTVDVTDTSARLGFVIADKIARMWSSKTADRLQAWNSDREVTVVPSYEDDTVLIADELTMGMTVSPSKNDCVLVAPIFE